MKILRNSLIVLTFLILGFTAKTASANTCALLPGGGNWNAAGTWGACGGVAPVAGDSVVATSSAGNLVINANTALLKSIDFTGYTGTLSGGFQLLIRGLAASTQVVTFSAGMTVTWTGALNIQPIASSAELDITTNGKIINSLSATAGSTGTIKLMDNMTFSNSVGLSVLNWGLAGTFDLNGFTISGSSVTNRVFINSGVPGTQRTLTLNGGTFANADFQDILFANGGSDLDLSAITGLSGDCLGNGMSGGGTLTFTSATTTYWIGNTGNWSNTAEWSSTSGGSGSTIRVPLPQDDAIFDSNSFSGTGFTVTANMPRGGRNVDFSLVGTDNPTLTFTANAGWAIYGSLYLDNGMTWTNITGITLDFRGRTAGLEIDSQGITIPRPTLFNAPGGNYTLLNDFSGGSSVAVTSGTLNGSAYGVTAQSFSTANSALAIVNMGSGTWTMYNPGNIWALGAGSSFNAQTSTLTFTNTTASVKTFATGGRTYNIVTFSGRNIITNGNPTYATLNLLNAGANGFRPTAGSTTTITSLITTNATSTAAYSLASSTSMTALAELKFTGGTTCGLDYMNFVRILATPPGAWLVGTNSTSTSSSGLTFTYNACGASAVPPDIYINGNTYINGNIYLNP